MHTQIRFIKRLIITLVVIIAGASMLLMFDNVRQLGTSILASAGIVGIVVGLAAQRSIANILVGMQIALTQPIRLDDVVIIENEWGRIEEITMTYVVVKLWDSRRLIVPSTYFTEKTFQNWTRVSSELLGTVFLYLDYTVPVDAIRQELQKILKASTLWDGKVGQVQVTNTSAQAMELRLLLSANDASLAWDLRCEVREKMIAFVQLNFPDSLPKIRGELVQQSDNQKRCNESRTLS
jgi:small-conductance mechanosensitive channel